MFKPMHALFTVPNVSLLTNNNIKMTRPLITKSHLNLKIKTNYKTKPSQGESWSEENWKWKVKIEAEKWLCLKLKCRSELTTQNLWGCGDRWPNPIPVTVSLEDDSDEVSSIFTFNWTEDRTPRIGVFSLRCPKSGFCQFTTRKTNSGEYVRANSLESSISLSRKVQQV